MNDSAQLEDVKKKFGVAIKNWRGKSGLSQEELAWRAGLHRSYLADIERGARNASLLSIEKLARALKVTLSVLFLPLSVPEPPPSISPNSSRTGKPGQILLAADDPQEVERVLQVFKKAKIKNCVYVAKGRTEALEFLLPRKDCQENLLKKS